MPPEISVVIPLYNEEPNVSQLYLEFKTMLEQHGHTYELILVDDGSIDDTFRMLADLHAKDNRVRVVRLRKNFGQTAALTAGFAYAQGRFIVTSDGDLQNDPFDVPAMLDQLERGYDIVSGWRKSRKDRWLTRRVPSMIANWLISLATGVHLHDYGCSLKVFRAEVVKPLRLYGDLHRFIPALASEQGVRIAEHVVNHRPRRFGRSKYGLSRIVQVIIDLISVKFLLSYSTRPLQVFGPTGLLLGTVGICITGYLGYVRLFGGQAIGDRPLMLLGILLVFSGVQLVALGLFAELQLRSYHESQGKPIYVVRELLESPIRGDTPMTVARKARGSVHP